jgi:Protein of unknown function, DUF481
MVSKRCLWVACTLALAAASAQADPAFEYGKADDLKDVKKVEWKAQAKAGLLITSGNSRSRTLSAAGTASRKAGNNKLGIEASVAYARSGITVAVDDDPMGSAGNGTIEESEITTVDKTTTQAFSGKLRYDRFFTANNSAFITAVASQDKPAGKNFVGGGQLGYSRQLLADARHLMRGEIGYDLSVEDLAGATDTVVIHSARLFFGYTLKVTPTTGASAELELLANLSQENTPTEDGTNQADAFEDVRATGKLGLTTQLWKNISFGFGFTVKVDTTPAPLAPLGLPFAAGFVPFADELDTTTEASLIVNLL